MFFATLDTHLPDHHIDKLIFVGIKNAKKRRWMIYGSGVVHVRIVIGDLSTNGPHPLRYISGHTAAALLGLFGDSGIASQ